MIVSGYYGELVITGDLTSRWNCWFASMAFFLYIVYELLLGPLRPPTLRRTQPSIGRHRLIFAGKQLDDGRSLSETPLSRLPRTLTSRSPRRTKLRRPPWSKMSSTRPRSPTVLFLGARGCPRAFRRRHYFRFLMLAKKHYSV